MRKVLNSANERSILALLELYTYDEVAAIEGVSKSTIYRVVKKANKLKKNEYEAKRKKITSLYKKHKSIQVVADLLGEKYKTVHYYITTKKAT
jgi:transposase